MLHSERPSAPEKRVCACASGTLGQARQSNRASKGVRYPKEGNRNGRRGGWDGVASQPLLPGKPPVGSLCTRKRSSRRRLSRWGWFGSADLHLLMAREGRKGSSMSATAPIAPQERLGRRSGHSGLGHWRDGGKWRENSAHPTWPHRFGSVPLALFAHGTGTAMTNSGGIDHAQRPVAFRSSFPWVKRMAFWTA